MANVELIEVGKQYPKGVEAVKEFSLKVEDSEFLILVGPSGCGKSTTLRMIAGLETISTGEIKIDEKLVNNVEPKNRDIAMIFQNYALYPHMTVFDNMAFSLKMQKCSRDVIKTKVEEAAAVLGIEDLLMRKPTALSGGQRQRVAMGRAIVREPKVFLMDEPLSSLDAKLRGQMRIELSKLHQRLGATIIYVTHDQTEAMTLGTRIVVMKDGSIMQVDTPENLYNCPGNVFVAGFIGTPQMNFFEAECRIAEDHALLVTKAAVIPLSKKKSIGLITGGYDGRKVIVGIRPEALHEAKRELIIEKDIFYFQAVVKVYEMMGAQVYIHFDFEDGHLTAGLDPGMSAREWDLIRLGMDTNKIYLFDSQTEKAVSGENLLSQL